MFTKYTLKDVSVRTMYEEEKHSLCSQSYKEKLGLKVADKQVVSVSDERVGMHFALHLLLKGEKNVGEM